MQKLEEEPFSIVYLGYLKVTDVVKERKPFRNITVFKRREGYSHFKHEALMHDDREIDRYIRERGLNYATMILEDHFIILTEQPLEFNPLLVKLTTGLDLRGEWEYDFNAWIRYEGAEGAYPSLLRE